MLGGKVRALVEGRYHVSFADIRGVAPMALRHRLILNFEAEADRVDSDTLVKQIVDMTPTEPMKAVG
jgi:MoxR-like ATPase